MTGMQQQKSYKKDFEKQPFSKGIRYVESHKNLCLVNRLLRNLDTMVWTMLLKVEI